MKTISYGVIIVEDFGDIPHLLMCHSTNNTFWDVPKGGGDPEELPINAAIRELFEETGFIVTADELLDIGVFDYNPHKNLHLFKYIGNNKFITNKAICNSFFECTRTKKTFPEVDDFQFIPFEKVSSYCAKSFKNVFQKLQGILKPLV